MIDILFDKVKTNLQPEDLLGFREVGYIDKVLSELFCLINPDAYEFYIYFKLACHHNPILIEKSNKKQIIFLVSDESSEMPHALKEQAFAIFRHYLPEKEQKQNLFHLPVGYSRAFKHNNNIALPDRKYNVFFSGNLHVGRQKLYKYLTKLHFLPFSLLHRLQSFIKGNFDHQFPNSFIRFSKGFHTGLSPEEYNSKLANSKILLCPPGLANVETMRLFEGMKAGCILISEPLPQVYCYKNSPIIIIQNWKELDNIIPELLSNPGKMEKLQQETIAWWESHCSEKATARYIGNIIKYLEINSKPGI